MVIHPTVLIPILIPFKIKSYHFLFNICQQVNSFHFTPSISITSNVVLVVWEHLQHSWPEAPGLLPWSASLLWIWDWKSHSAGMPSVGHKEWCHNGSYITDWIWPLLLTPILPYISDYFTASFPVSHAWAIDIAIFLLQVSLEGFDWIFLYSSS